jgi:hypothetical protein
MFPKLYLMSGNSEHKFSLARLKVTRLIVHRTAVPPASCRRDCARAACLSAPLTPHLWFHRRWNQVRVHQCRRHGRNRPAATPGKKSLRATIFAKTLVCTQVQATRRDMKIVHLLDQVKASPSCHGFPSTDTWPVNDGVDIPLTTTGRQKRLPASGCVFLRWPSPSISLSAKKVQPRSPRNGSFALLFFFAMIG